ncbi:hypothetical protein [Bradyrhizobium sp. LB11.1]|uniref:hypothetical protein n=1 Tax=Bradyrhizobium sp. LB11.1 TaxID=3156326 RepID=UPI0033946CC6
MNSRPARLYGVISPTGLNDGFYVPVFIDPEHSNHQLVQVVNEQDYIESFEPFFATANVRVVSLDVVRRVGDPAFWYFELKDGPLYGSIEDVQSGFQRRRVNIEENPHIALQIMIACGIEGQESTIQAVRNSMFQNIGRTGADAWLDTNILSPKIRGWLVHSSRRGRKADFESLLSKVLVITKDNVTSVLAPEALRDQVGASGWRNMTTQLALLLKQFGLQFAEVTFLERGTSQRSAPSNVPLLKREAASAFARAREVTLQQMTKSYFEAPSGEMRVVCTFSSRYENKGKRKYWFGYHKIWDRWLEGSREGFLLLGCKDSRRCFALPLSFVQTQLPNLRFTGTGKDQYWHLDIVDVGNEKNLLDVPRLQKTIELSRYSFVF